jgi:hypothetical protein
MNFIATVNKISKLTLSQDIQNDYIDWAELVRQAASIVLRIHYELVEDDDSIDDWKEWVSDRIEYTNSGILFVDDSEEYITIEIKYGRGEK